MAAETGPETAPLIDGLLERGHAFSFYQVMRLARAWLGPDALERNRVRVRPELGLGFPAADVAHVEQDGDGLRVTVRFGGLYGVDSPLATFQTEELLEDAANDSFAARGFLDVIQQRLYYLLARCWNKYRTLVRLVEEGDPAEKQRAWCHLGMGEGEPVGLVPGSFPLLRYGNLFARLTRPVSALEAMLKDALGIDRIEIIQCVRRLVSIPDEQQMRLDVGNNTLDVDAVLGADVEDRMGKMTIRIGPLTWEEYNSLLPETFRFNLLTLLVHLYLPHPLVLELELVLAEGEARPFILDDPGFRLDFNVFVFDDVMPETGVRFPLAQPSLQVDGSSESAFPGEEESAPKLVKHYQKELAHLRELAADFGREHPALAPLVGGPMADPGIERVLEGTAFLCALLRLKLDDDLPEIIHEIIRNTRPEHLCPIPATTVIAFTPKPNCTGTHTIPAGTEVASVPVEGTSCRFTTVYPVELHPLELLDASYSRPPGRSALITLVMELRGMRLADWKPERVRFFLSGEFGRAADLYLLFTRHVRSILLIPLEGGAPAALEPSCLKPVGFGDGERLFPTSAEGAVSFHVVREHAVLPEKYLFLDLTGWDAWRDRGEGTRFEVRFELERPPFTLETVTREDFTLFAAPAVNVFPHKAKPIALHDEEAEYPVIPEGGKPGHHAVYSIEKVTGALKGTSEDITFSPSAGSGWRAGRIAQFSEVLSEAPLRQGVDRFIAIKLPHDVKPSHISELSVNLLCTNGNLAEQLQPANIRVDTDNSPHFATFTNSKPVTKPRFDTLGDNRLWRLFGLQFVNLRLVTAESLRTALKLLAVSDNQDYATKVLNEKRIEGIRNFKVEAGDRLISQVMRRGWNIRITLDPGCYGSTGDIYLFGAVLDHFLRGFVSEAYFSRLIVGVIGSGMGYEWTAKMGRRLVV